jgi:hypothetical protein
MSDVPSPSPAMPDPEPLDDAVPARRDLEAFPLTPLAPAPDAAPPRRRGIAFGIAAAVTAVAAIAAFTVLRSSDSPFPERIGNYERMHDATARTFEDQLDSFEMKDVSYQGAMYAEARSSVPGLVVVVVRVDPTTLRLTPLRDFMRGASWGFAGSGAGSIELDDGTSDSRTGVEYFCASVDVAAGASIFGDSVACGWKASDHLGMAFVTHTSDVHAGLDQAEVVVGALDT